MKEKVIGIWLALLLVGTIFTVIFTGSVSAMTDEQNLSGLVWQSDGSAPTVTTEFCIWVNHSGVWYRFPETVWAYTEIGDDGTCWYSYVLPDEYHGNRWDNGDEYRVQVNGRPWGDYNGNATSNGTGSLGDPFPTPYDPTNPANTYNDINYLAGGGFENEQQWDVRTVAPIDLVPTKITVNGITPDLIGGVPVGPGEIVTIIFNVTNFGLVPTGIPFKVIIWNCSATGENNGSTPIMEFILGPLNEYGNTSGTGYDIVIPIPVLWVAPSSPGDHYINITVDSDYEIPEIDEVNNTVILYFKIGPDLTVTNVFVDFTSISPGITIYVGPGEVVRIDASAWNVGNSPTGAGFDMALYNITGLNGPIIPGHQAFKNIISDSLDAGNISEQQTWNWTAPWDAGDHYVNITVDYENAIPEGNEKNNSFTIHFAVEPDLTPNNVSVDGVPFGGQVIRPLETVIIGVNASNIGSSSTGIYTFRITYTNCTASGDTGGNTPFYISSYVGPVSANGYSQDVFGLWVMPFSQTIFDYYINITIDYYNEVSETNELNNYFIMHLRMAAPDLTPLEVSLEVAGSNISTYSSIPPYLSDEEPVPLNQSVNIWIIVKNVGGVGTEETNVTFYNVSGEDGPPIDVPFWEEYLPPIPAGGIAIVNATWPNPGLEGLFYINISIDFNGTLDINGKILELNELNNTFTLIINITSLPVTILEIFDPNYKNKQYINSSTPLNLTPISGKEPIFTWYGIFNMSNGSYALGWSNYTEKGIQYFTMIWGEGPFRIEFNSSDSAGAHERLRIRYVIVDNSPPVTNITIGNPRYRGNDSHNWNITSSTPITLSAIDYPLGMNILNLNNASGISGIYYLIRCEDNNTNVTEWRKYSPGIPFRLDNPDWVDGNYSILFNSTDNLGQKEETNYIEVYLDKTGPDRTITVGDPKHPHPTYDWFVKSTTLFTLEAFEAIGSGVNEDSIAHRITYNDATPPRSSIWINRTDFNIRTSFMQGDGNYTIRFRAQDNLGNMKTAGIMEIYVDDTPPVTTLTFGEPKYRAQLNDTLNITSHTQLNLTATDGLGSGVIVTQYTIYNSTFDTGWITYTDNFTFSSDWSDGIYNIEYNSTDNLGNAEPTNNRTIYLDNTPPDTIVDVGEPRYRANDAIDIWNITSQTSLNLTADDGPGCGVDFTQYRIRNSTFDSGWATYTANFTISSDLSDGIYTLEHNSTDYLGNQKTEPMNIYLDNTGPTTYIYGGQDNWNAEQNAWEINFSIFFSLDADDGMGSGVDYIEYSITLEDGTWSAWQTYTTPFNLTLEEHGYWLHTIQFRAYDNLGTLGPTDTLDVYIEGDITPPRPPILRLRVSGDDIVLEWEHSPDPDIDHYLIYKSTTKMGFNFSDVWVDTSQDDDHGTIPLRTTWNHTGAVIGEPEYYYCMRGVDVRGNIGYTSNIAGKVTMTFEKGYNDFALPLESFEEIRASEMLSGDVFADDADTIYRYDMGSQQWMGHPKFLPASIDDFVLEMGEGYMLLIMEDEVEYTFTGSTGTAIRYIEGVGDELTFREGLTAQAQGDEVQLNWELASDATGYAIYRASARMDSGSLTDYDIQPVANVSADTTSWTDTDADDDEYYYVVVAKDEAGEQSSTYAIGVKRYLFRPDFSVFSFELEPKTSRGVARYATDMFSWDSNTLYYYDKGVGTWCGHPKFVPENINNVEVSMGSAYIAYVHRENVAYAFTGI